MHTYLLLAHPAHNRFQMDAALRMARTELACIAASCATTDLTVEDGPAALPDSLELMTEQPLSEELMRAIGASSVYHALFAVEQGELLRPLRIPDFHVFPESMVRILKYQGKTNERFTRLMLNLALCACHTGRAEKTLLDPMCGKGTTLFEGMIRGMDATGIEASPKSHGETVAYVQRFLKEGRFKHRLAKSKRSDEKGRKKADLVEVVTAADKRSFSQGDTQCLWLVRADTRECATLLASASHDLLVCDLPYGVQHGSRSKGKGMARSPLALLEESLEGWRQVLRPGAGVALSFNEHTLRHAALTDALKAQGFEVLSFEPDVFRHRVDQAIVRNIIVARRRKGSGGY